MRAHFVLLSVLLLVTSDLARAQDEWRTYENETYGYAIEQPVAGFTRVETDKGVTLSSVDGRGQIDIYGAVNEQSLDPLAFKAALAGADRIREITYSRDGKSWLAVSGYYRRDGDSADDLIFYAKFMFSPDRTVLAAFEASYPVADKRRYDSIIERMEDSLTAPSDSRLQ